MSFPKKEVLLPSLNLAAIFILALDSFENTRFFFQKKTLLIDCLVS